MLVMNECITENKINEWLYELDKDRQKFFNDIRLKSGSDQIKENKISNIEMIQKQLIKYKKLLSKDKERKNE